MSDTTIMQYDDLVSYNRDNGKRSGAHRRFYCPVHGGDHQRSLAIVDDGDKVGIGHCHTCHANVVVERYPGKAPYQAAYRTPAPRTQAARVSRLLTPLAARHDPPPVADTDLLTLRRLWPRMTARLADERPRQYLEARGLDLDTITGADIGYIPVNGNLTGTLAKWQDRLMFPLWRPDVEGGYIGRSLRLWEPGIDEVEHKARLESSPYRRWEKTNVAGWYAAPAMADIIIICEGVFDALALMMIGLERQDIVALAGTACDVSWLPQSVQHVILALDGDAVGMDRMNKIAIDLIERGIEVTLAPPPSDDLGKDASERYRKAGYDGLQYIL